MEYLVPLWLKLVYNSSRALVSRDMSRLETLFFKVCLVSRNYFSKSRSRRYEVSVSVSSRHLEVSENGDISQYLLFHLWNYFSIQICRKNPISRLLVKSKMNILMNF